MFSFFKKVSLSVKTERPRRVLLIALQAILIGIAIALAVISLPNNPAPIDFQSFSLVKIFIGVFFYILSYLAFAVHWSFALSVIENKKMRLEQMGAFLASQPYKYLPTSLFSFSARSIYSKKIGAESLASTAKAQLVEYGSIFASGLTIMTLAKTGLSALALIVAGLTVSAYLLYEKLYVNRVRGKTYRYFVLILISSVAWLMAGAAFYWIIQGVGGGVHYKEALFINTAAHLASIAAVLVPAGIGIREAILFSQNIGYVGAVTWRICSIAIDIVAGTAAIIAINRKKARAPSSAQLPHTPDHNG